MTSVDMVSTETERVLRTGEPDDVTAAAAALSVPQAVEALERLSRTRRAAVFRVLAPPVAFAVFDRLDPALQQELVAELGEERALELFTQLGADDRARLLEQTPDRDADRLLAGLPAAERDRTTALMDYPRGSVGQWMTSRYLSAWSHATAEQALELVRQDPQRSTPGHAVVVTDTDGTLVGMVDLRELLTADPAATMGGLAHRVHTVLASTDVERAARECARSVLLTLPVVDPDGHVLGVFTGEDALRVLEEEETEDRARSGGSEPLRRPYLSTSVLRLVRSRIVWLLVLAVSAVLTVRVLEVFEATLDQMVVLALFIPLLTGTGGNTGNQAATTVTRALALGDVRVRDIVRVLLREVRVGAALGLVLGTLGFAVATVVYGPAIGAVIGSTLLGVCTMAASVGGAMPLIGKALGADPAVFSNPFISTFCDATGLILYFLIAKLILNL